MLSRTGEYALRAVLFLADDRQEDRQEEWISVDRIAEALQVPRNYLSKTLHALTRQGILASSRGPRGGFRLAVPPERLLLLQVVSPFESLGERRTCLLGRPRCSDRNPCPAHARWKTVADEVARFFGETTVGDLLEDPGSATAMEDVVARSETPCGAR